MSTKICNRVTEPVVFVGYTQEVVQPSEQHFFNPLQSLSRSQAAESVLQFSRLFGSTAGQIPFFSSSVTANTGFDVDSDGGGGRNVAKISFDI